MFGWRIVSRAKMPLGGRELRRGMAGFDVKELQHFLGHLRLYRGDEDGIFGPRVEESIADLQKMLCLPADGIFSFFLMRFLTDPVGGGRWYPVDPESRDKEGRGGRGSSIIQVKSIWAWMDEHKPEMAFDGYLVRPEKVEDRTGETPETFRTVYTVDSLTASSDKSNISGEWVYDLRREEPKTIRKVLRKSMRNGRAWIWLRERMLQIPGMAAYLGIISHQRKAAGVILELSPEIGEGKRVRHRPRRVELPGSMPVMLSLDLRPRLYINNEEKLLSQKEGRIWRNREMGEGVRRVGVYRWATRQVRKDETEGRLWWVDPETLAAVYRSMVFERRAGIVLEGLTGANPRGLETYRDYFSIENIGHEKSIRHIYLKREKSMFQQDNIGGKSEKRRMGRGRV